MNLTEKQLIICVGAQKAGTSWLFKCMEEHPNICAAEGKETNFFLRENLSHKEYSLFFSKCPNNKNYFEASPLYLYDSDTPKKIKSLFPSAKIIIILRNPIQRSLSHYRHLINKSAIDNNEHFKKNLYDRPDIIKNSLYRENVIRYRNVFSDKNILLLDFADIENQPQRILDDVCKFCEIQTFSPKFLRTKYNTSSARANPLYNKVTKVYLIFIRYAVGRQLIRFFRFLGIKSDFVEVILSKTSTNSTEGDTTKENILKDKLSAELEYYNNIKYEF